MWCRWEGDRYEDSPEPEEGTRLKEPQSEVPSLALQTHRGTMTWSVCKGRSLCKPIPCVVWPNLSNKPIHWVGAIPAPISEMAKLRLREIIEREEESGRGSYKDQRKPVAVHETAPWREEWEGGDGVPSTSEHSSREDHWAIRRCIREKGIVRSHKRRGSRPTARRRPQTQTPF